MSQWSHYWDGMVKTVKKEGNQNELNVQKCEYVQKKIGRRIKWAKLGRTEYGTMGEVEGED